MIKYVFNSYQNWMEERTNWKRLTLIFIHAQIIHRDLFIPLPLFTFEVTWFRGEGTCLISDITHWICTQWISSGVMFDPNATVLKFLKLLFFVYLMELIVYIGFYVLNSYIILEEIEIFTFQRGFDLAVDLNVLFRPFIKAHLALNLIWPRETTAYLSAKRICSQCKTFTVCNTISQ